MPSAAEIETKGLSLGEISKLQQQKIEELTLYLIEEDRDNKKSEERIQQLENATKNTASKEDKLKYRIQKIEVEKQAIQNQMQALKNQNQQLLAQNSVLHQQQQEIEKQKFLIADLSKRLSALEETNQNTDTSK